jgi:flagellar basal body rod protein FlgC
MAFTQEQKAAYLRSLERDGRLDPHAVVKAAKADPNCPIHADFEWDIKRAAEANWLDTARRLISNVRVVFIQDDKPMRLIHYTHDPRLPANTPGYVALPAVKLAIDAGHIIEAECSRAMAAITRARQVAAALRLESEMEELLGNLSGIRQRASEEAAALVAPPAAKGKRGRKSSGSEARV